VLSRLLEVGIRRNHPTSQAAKTCGGSGGVVIARQVGSDNHSQQDTFLDDHCSVHVVIGEQFP
jgi:hypothetical protein